MQVKNKLVDFDDGAFHTGWKEELGSWYYLDPTNFASDRNALKDIDGKVYCFNEYGHMSSNSIIEIAGIKIVSGCCMRYIVCIPEKKFLILIKSTIQQ